MARDGYLTGFIKGVVNVLTGGAGTVDDQLREVARRDERERRVAGSLAATRATQAAADATAKAQAGRTATIEIDPPALAGLRLAYPPERAGDPDAGRGR